MGLFINTKVASINAQRNLGRAESAPHPSLSRLTVGARIFAADVSSARVRMRESTVHASSGTLGGKERGYWNDAVHASMTEIDRSASVTEQNGRYFLHDVSSAGVSFQMGLNADAPRPGFRHHRTRRRRKNRYQFRGDNCGPAHPHDDRGSDIFGCHRRSPSGTTPMSGADSAPCRTVSKPRSSFRPPGSRASPLQTAEFETCTRQRIRQKN